MLGNSQAYAFIIIIHVIMGYILEVCGACKHQFLPLRSLGVHDGHG